jgi:PKD repeat protein
MKTGLVALLSIWLALGNALHATHIVGGDIHYECLGGNTYLIVLKVYRDCQTGISPYDDPACVGIFNSAGTLIENVQIPLASATITNLPVDTGDPCLEAPEGLCVTEAIYTAEVELDDIPGGYTMAYQRCCRNTTIVNCASNDDIGMTVYAQIPDPDLALCNSNPSFNEFPPVVICLNEPFVFDHSATDLDGDSLVYEFCNPLLTNVPGNYICPPGAPDYPLLDFYPQYSFDYPLDADPAFEVNPITGLLTGTPTQLGKYVVGICVKEFRNGQLISTTNRDFQFNIAPCSLDVLADIDPGPPCTGLTMNFGNGGIGDSWFWDFGDTSTDADTAVSITATYEYPVQGVYTVMLISNPGFQCADTAFAEVPVFPPLEATINAAAPACVNGDWQIEFGATGNYSQDAQFSWDFDSGNPDVSTLESPGAVTFTGSGPNTITLSVEDPYCEVSTYLEVEIPPAPDAIITPQSDFCEGLTNQFESTTTGAVTWSWDFGQPGNGDTSTQPNPSFTYSDYGNYTVTLTVNAGTECEVVTTQEVVILPPDPIELVYSISEPDICDTLPRVEVQWSGTGATSILWSFGDGETSSNWQEEHIYDTSSPYTVTLTVTNELCDYSETISEDITPGLGPINRPIVVPNIFTPTGDGKNELFCLFYEGQGDDFELPDGKTVFDYLSFYQLKIYDRWGVLMYDSEDDGQCWDGNRSREATDGVYYYILSFQRKCLDTKAETRDGYVHLVRGKN